MIATLGNFATKQITGSQTGITQGSRDAAGARARRPHGVRVPAPPPGRGAAHARRWSSTLREDFAKLPALLAEPLPELEGSPPPRMREATPPERRSRRASSTCSLDGRAQRRAGGDRGASARGSPRACVPATWSWSAASSARGKTTLVRGACRELGVTEPVVSPTFTIGRRYHGRGPVSHLDLYRLDGLDRRGAGAARRLPDARTRSRSSSGPSEPGRSSSPTACGLRASSASAMPAATAARSRSRLRPDSRSAPLPTRRW